MLFNIYTADIPQCDNTLIATYADDTAIMASDSDPKQASQSLQDHLNKIQEWTNNWHISINNKKSMHVTFTLRRETCPPVHLQNDVIPQVDNVRYLGMYLDRRMNWKHHIVIKRRDAHNKFLKLYWLIKRKSELSLENKLVIYKSVIKPIWTYGIQLWYPYFLRI